MMDIPLDEIIKANQKYGNKRSRGGRGGFKRGNNKGSGGPFRRMRTDFKRNSQPYRKPKLQREDSNFDDDTVWEHDLFQEEEEMEEFVEENNVPVKAIETGTKLSITNLEYSVSEENLKEIFEKIGAVKKVSILYDRSGRSEGTAEVIFVRRVDAQNALKNYNGVEIDGKVIRLAMVGSNIPVQRIQVSRGGRRNARSKPGLVVSARGSTARRVRIGGNRGNRGRGRRYNR